MATTHSSRSALDVGDNHLSNAFQRIDQESNAVLEKLAAYQDFRSRVESLPSTTQSISLDPPRNRTLPAHPDAEECPARAVLDAFSEVIIPHCAANPSSHAEVLTILEQELTAGVAEGIAAAATANSFPAQVKAGIIAVIQQEEQNLEAIDHALTLERESVKDADEVLSEIIGNLLNHQSTSLYDLGYGGLYDIWMEIQSLIDQLDETVVHRNSDITRISETNGTKIIHKNLITKCYEPLDPEYPVLQQVAVVRETCLSASETIEDHLIYRF